MGKAMIKETMKKSVTGVLDLDNEEILVEVEGYDEPLELRELFAMFNGRSIKIDMALNIEHKPEE